MFRTRDLLVRQRTQLINAIRGHLTEYGWVAPKGPSYVGMLADLLDEEEMGSSLPPAALAMIRLMLDLLADLDGRIAELDGDRAARPRGRGVAAVDDDSRRGPDHCNCNRGPRSAGRDLRKGARLRRLARACPAAEVDGRQAQARRDLKNGRPHAQASAHHRRHGGDKTGGKARRTEGALGWNRCWRANRGCWWRSRSPTRWRGSFGRFS